MKSAQRAHFASLPALPALASHEVFGSGFRDFNTNPVRRRRTPVGAELGAGRAADAVGEERSRQPDRVAEAIAQFQRRWRGLLRSAGSGVGIEGCARKPD